MRKPVYGRTRAEAAAKLQAAQAAAAAGVVVGDERRTTESFLRWWLEEAKAPTVKANTADSYRWLIESYIIPHVGRVRLTKLGPEHVHSMMRALEAKGLSARTIDYARSVLRAALNHALRWQLVSRNAASLAAPPRAARSVIDDALSRDEAASLLRAVKGTPIEAIVTIALAVGLRRGEALALKWEHIDLDSQLLRVEGTLYRRTGAGLVIDTPKTERSRRAVPLPGICVQALRDHRRRQAADRLAAGTDWHETGFVFTSPIGTPIDPRNLTRDFHVATDAAGLGRRRFHALRHSAATLMLSMEVPLEVISRTLGHSGLAVTADVYASVGIDLRRKAADAMDRALSPLAS